MLDLHEWNFLYLIAAALAFIAVELLLTVKETGEVEKDVVVRMIRSNIKSNLREYFVIGQLIDLHDSFRNYLRKRVPGRKEKIIKDV